MANTDTSAISNLVQTAYDRLVEFNLRSQPLFRTLADKKPAQQAMPGSSVVFQLYNDLSDATSTLTEGTDVTAVAVGNTTTVTATLAEYGNAVVATRKLRLLSLSDVDPAIADMVAFNMASSVDTLVQTELRNTTNKASVESGTLKLSSATVGNVTSSDVITSAMVRGVVAKLRANNVVPVKGQLFPCYIHPEVSHDLRKETGAAAWRDPHNYSAPDAIWAGEIGTYEGAFFVESSRCYNATDGATSTRVFRSYIAGRQAIAEAVAEEFHLVIGPITDSLMRNRPIGWYGVAGWKVYRSAASWQLWTTSSIHSS